MRDDAAASGPIVDDAGIGAKKTDDPSIGAKRNVDPGIGAKENVDPGIGAESNDDAGLGLSARDDASPPRLPPEMRLDDEGRAPLFQQIAAILRDRLASGELAAGDRLPSEAELCAIWGVSRITAKRAMDLLAADGLVERARGRGTTVLHRAPAPAAAARLEGWLENLHRLADATEVELLDFGYRAAPRHVADQLRLPAGAPVQRAVRVRRLDGAAVSHLESWVPEALGRRWDAEALRSGSLLRLLEGSGVRLASARQSISAAAATPAVAAALGLSPGAALLDVRRRVLDAGGRPVEYIRTLYRPDLHRYEMELGGVAG